MLFQAIEDMTEENFQKSAYIKIRTTDQMDMKLVLSETDSLGFWLARDNELYDRVRMVHTTFIPYREYSRILGINSIDEYIRYGGTFRMGEIDFDDKDLQSDDASFRDDESTRRYILYFGENMDSKEGIAYRNAEEFLKNLPNISLNSELEESG